MFSYEDLLAQLLGGSISGGSSEVLSGYDADLAALLGGDVSGGLSAGGVTINVNYGPKDEEGGKEKGGSEPEPNPPVAGRKIEEAQRLSQSMKDGDVVLVTLESFGEGAMAKAQEGDNFQRLVSRAVAQMPGARRPDSLSIIDHPLNSKITKTEGYGYKKLVGKPGPLLSKGYNGLFTRKGSGRSFTVLFVAKEV